MQTLNNALAPVSPFVFPNLGCIQQLDLGTQKQMTNRIMSNVQLNGQLRYASTAATGSLKNEILRLHMFPQRRVFAEARKKPNKLAASFFFLDFVFSRVVEEIKRVDSGLDTRPLLKRMKGHSS